MSELNVNHSPRGTRRHGLKIAPADRHEAQARLALEVDAQDPDYGDDAQFNDAHEPSWEACPHIERNDERCGHRFSLGRIEQAFSVCFGCFAACPVFHRLNSEVSLDASESERPSQVLIEVRVLAGRSAAIGRKDSFGDARLGAVGQLRQTGS